MKTVVECIHKGCNAEPHKVEREVDHPSLALLLAMCFHSCHEGHLMRVVIDGTQLFPPSNLG